ncbi:hypothetical protein GCM10010503_52280 [Streptomyces lucensis JCM 4490]|uniref:Hydroxyacylglutathione hydrolase n=1 Tax=Streptomyces lucensis JCM 4490 TaxID=1306176 RepID=A0A918MTT0_9ACTN|nr:hypothetical protein GCM10010503_52280 [Streptomyces lucensis JCM 4490]
MFTVENPRDSQGASATPARTPRRSPSLIHDVETKIFGTLPDETWVYPGHGNDTTLGAERPHLPEWHARGW